MLFSSPLFIFSFFPIFFIVYYLVPQKTRNLVIILASFMFYFWASSSFTILIILTLFVDWILSKFIFYKKYDKLCLLIDLLMNFGILIYFKYFNFFSENFNLFLSLLGLNTLHFNKVILPIGISFVIFQKVTYCIDVYRDEVKPADNFFHLIEYILLFPQIIAGPIIKYHEIALQIINRKISWNSFIYGFNRFALGIFKKVWIADNLANLADNVFSITGNIPTDYAWIGAITYTFQIFFDFAAYSDMAIGMLSMMGFTIHENFNNPYISTSLTEFWKRWHISLTTWFREYLYYPLGGNRKGKRRTYFNYWIVFIISGFWHGASWNFIFWGAYHGTLVCIEKKYILNKNIRIPRIISFLITQLIIIIGWVFFRADNITDAFSYILAMFNFQSNSFYIDPFIIMNIDYRHKTIILIAFLVSFFPLFTKTYKIIKEYVLSNRLFVNIYCLFLFVLSIIKIITSDFSPFIYFRF